MYGYTSLSHRLAALQAANKTVRGTAVSEAKAEAAARKIADFAAMPDHPRSAFRTARAHTSYHSRRNSLLPAAARLIADGGRALRKRRKA